MFPGSIHVIARIRILCFCCWITSIVRIFHILFIHSSVVWHLNCFYFLTITNNAAVNIRIQDSVWSSIFISLGGNKIPRSGIPGSYYNYVFNLLRSCQTVFQGGCTILLSHQCESSCYSVSSSALFCFWFLKKKKCIRPTVREGKKLKQCRSICSKLQISLLS